jgi:hypothetical protein
MTDGGVVHAKVDLDRLFRLRLVVARVGEGDLAGWWNTKGQLGALGASVLRRGFPRTHRFAQSRSVFEVAARRCEALYDPPNSVTLWNLPAELEDDFEEAWATWIDQADVWEPFFVELEACSPDLGQELLRLGLIDDEQANRASHMKVVAEGRAVAVPGEFTGSAGDLSLLALGFARGQVGSPAVPFQSWSGSA